MEERENYIDGAHILEFLPDVIFDDQDFVGSHFAGVIDFTGRVGDGKDFVWFHCEIGDAIW
jgi:hypothetical protein